MLELFRKSYRNAMKRYEESNMLSDKDKKLAAAVEAGVITASNAVVETAGLATAATLLMGYVIADSVWSETKKAYERRCEEEA